MGHCSLLLADAYGLCASSLGLPPGGTNGSRDEGLCGLLQYNARRPSVKGGWRLCDIEVTPLEAAQAAPIAGSGTDRISPRGDRIAARSARELFGAPLPTAARVVPSARARHRTTRRCADSPTPRRSSRRRCARPSVR